ncbi:hypothetical protein BJY16_001544 [Actinoplanes octamycinicus]|uniref:Uncharacterized protein n=1 Tax=Actinoplanes octamycinicus TaxID=135948 RepID=A0A7W7GTL9_9ACTN|nr:hypothetical protein [Actinoplanes octamycinicus]GIE59362.1 hypothetical protein Aoc01nite_47640 [Actinoplanes octamycinicus]
MVMDGAERAIDGSLGDTWASANWDGCGTLPRLIRLAALTESDHMGFEERGFRGSGSEATTSGY